MRVKQISLFLLYGQFRWSISGLCQQAHVEALEYQQSPYFLQLPAEKKTHNGEEAYNPNNLVCRAMSAIRECTNNIGIIADVALDPYTTHGQDGLLRDGVVVNDETLESTL